MNYIVNSMEISGAIGTLRAFFDYVQGLFIILITASMAVAYWFLLLDF